MSFKDQPFSARMGTLGDRAEAVLEAVYPRGVAPYGLRRPPIRVNDLPTKLRHTPDFISSKGLIEVVGFGRDQTIKIRCDKITSLLEWDREFQTDLFLYDSHKQRYTFCPVQTYVSTAVPASEIAEFHDGGVHYRTPAVAVPTEWVDYVP